jgi:hypothetical protein
MMRDEQFLGLTCYDDSATRPVSFITRMPAAKESLQFSKQDRQLSARRAVTVAGG